MFRSKLIDKLAEVETWAVDRLRAANPGRKMKPTLGLRLGAVKTLTESHPHLFRHAATAARLIDELRPFQDLRSTLAHATLAVAHQSDGVAFSVFDRADADADMPWATRITLLDADFRQIWKRVSDLANQIKQQTPSSV